MAINQNLSWAQVGAIGTGPGTTVSDAFAASGATKELLPAGTELYKFSSFQTLSSNIYKDNRQKVSPWWSPTLPFKSDIGIIQKKNMAKHFGVSLREWARVTSVLNEAWSSVAWIIYIRLEQPAYGFFGGFHSLERHAQNGARSQRAASEASGGTRNLPGGGGSYQFYIPNLTMGDVKVIRSEFVSPNA